jgi:hypothetical protein
MIKGRSGYQRKRIPESFGAAVGQTPFAIMGGGSRFAGLGLGQRPNIGSSGRAALPVARVQG